MEDLELFADRYIAVWNEPDSKTRGSLIAELWCEDAEHYSQTIEAVGLDAVVQRIASAHDKFVKNGGFVFKALNDVNGHHQAVRFTWVMVPLSGGEAVAAGSLYLLLDKNGLIQSDYHFVEPIPQEEGGRL
jgi:hypothetical protein